MVFKDDEGNQKAKIIKILVFTTGINDKYKALPTCGQKIRTPVCPNEEINMSPYMIGYTST